MAKTKVTPKKTATPPQGAAPAADGGNEPPKATAKKKSARRKSMVEKANSDTGLSQEDKTLLLTRVFRFLSGLGLQSVIRTYLDVKAGYNDDIHDDGWNKLNKAGSFRKKKTGVVSEAHQKAIVTIDAWDEPNFARAKAVLEFQFPDQYEYLFEDLEAAQGAEAVRTVETFLDRVDALHKGSDATRQTSRKKDRDAIQRLIDRKIISPEIIKDLREQIAVVKSSTSEPTSLAEIKLEEEQKASFLDLAVWYAEWSQSAHAVVKKRSHLITLGLAKRRSSKEADAADNDDANDANDETDPTNNPQEK